MLVTIITIDRNKQWLTINLLFVSRLCSASNNPMRATLPSLRASGHKWFAPSNTTSPRHTNIRIVTTRESIISKSWVWGLATHLLSAVPQSHRGTRLGYIHALYPNCDPFRRLRAAHPILCWLNPPKLLVTCANDSAILQCYESNVLIEPYSVLNPIHQCGLFTHHRQIQPYIWPSRYSK